MPTQWAQVLFTDETWVNGTNHRKIYVTRRPGEELDPTCLRERVQRPKGWMFWGSISGFQKGPCCFWEKAWGKISSESYRTHIIPRIAEYIYDHPGTILMQDGAPGHRAAATIDDLNQRGITVLEWPPYSPDLNPIETLWNIMKDWIQRRYGHIDTISSYPRLRRIIEEAWEAIPDERVHELIESMPARCQAVIDANGGHTIY